MDFLNCLIFIKNDSNIKIDILIYNIMYSLCTKYTKLFMLKNNIMNFNKLDIISFIKYIKFNLEFNKIKLIIKEHFNPYYPYRYYDESTNMIDNIYIYYLSFNEIIKFKYPKYDINCSECDDPICIYNDYNHPNYMNMTRHYCWKCNISTKYDKGLYIIKYSNTICIVCGEYIAYSIKRTSDKIPPHCKCSYQTAMY